MNISPDLGKLSTSAEKRFVKLDILRREALGSERKEAILAFVTIEALGTWANFMRCYYLSCVSNCISKTGVKISSAHSSPGRVYNQKVGEAVHIVRPGAGSKADGSWNRRDEPTWHDDAAFLRVCTAIGLSNTTDIQAAFSSGSRVFKDLVTIRNFFAHRNRQTLAAAMTVGTTNSVIGAARPIDVLTCPRAGRAISLLEDWLSDLKFTAQYLCI